MNPRFRFNWGALSYWMLNIAALFLAEVLDSAAYLGDETPWVGVAALATYAALAAGAWLAWQLLAGVLARVGASRPVLRRLDPWLAFAPGLALLAPKLRIAAVGWSHEMLGLLLLAAGGAALLTRQLRSGRSDLGRRRWAAYAWACLGIWAFTVPVAGLEAVVDRSTTSMGALWGYNRFAALSVGGASLACSAYLARAVRPARYALRSAGLAGALLAVALLSRPSDAPLAGGTRTAHAAPARMQAGSPPVILITMDTTRADHLSVYGYARDTSPALVALARDAVVYSHAFATSSWTLPTHASLFTGLMPSRHHADRTADGAGSSGPRPAAARTHPLSQDHVTLAEWLGENGYRTGAVASNFAYLSHASGLDQGFEFHESRANSGTVFAVLDVIDRRIVTLPWLRRALLPYRPARAIRRRALDWVGTVREEPFLLFMNFMEPHTPNVPGLRYREFAGDNVGQRFGSSANRRAVDLYDSEIASMDAEVGRFLDGLRARGLYDRSLIIVTADHGESLGEHGVWGHGYTLNEPEVQVPLIVKYPLSAKRGTRRRPVSVVDVLPTIASAIGIAPPVSVQGELPTARHIVMAELHATPSASGSVASVGHRVALYDHGRKLVRDSDGHSRVYDLATDPGEARDVAGLHRLWLRDRIGAPMMLRALN